MGEGWERNEMGEESGMREEWETNGRGLRKECDLNETRLQEK